VNGVYKKKKEDNGKKAAAFEPERGGVFSSSRIAGSGCWSRRF